MMEGHDRAAGQNVPWMVACVMSPILEKWRRRGCFRRCELANRRDVLRRWCLERKRANLNFVWRGIPGCELDQQGSSKYSGGATRLVLSAEFFFFFFFWLPSFPLQRAATILQTVAMSELKRELYIMSMSSRVATNDGVCGGDGKVETVDRRFRVLSGQSCEATSGNHPQWVKAVRRDAFMA